MADIYMRLNYEEWKAIEKGMREFNETIHTTATGYYHKTFRLPLGEGNTFELMGLR